MTKKINYILILIILILIFLNLNFYKSDISAFDDIMIFSLWNNQELNNEVEIDVFTTSDNKLYKKIAPGTKGSFVIEFKRAMNLKYKIKITEKTVKPHNLVFSIGNTKYTSLEEMEKDINESFKNTEKITIHWEWEYYIDDANDIQDTKDAKNVKRYIFNIEAIVEE